MSTDESVTKDLMQTLEDGKDGYEKAATRLEESGHNEAATVCRKFSAQREGYYLELKNIAATYGDSLKETGSLAGAVHRGWMALTDAVTGSSAKAVLHAAEQGDDHAVKEYDKALASDLSPTLRDIVERQRSGVQDAHDQIERLHDQAASE